MLPKLEAFCKKCKTRMPIETLENKPWHGWRIARNGQTVSKQIDNMCCPDCGSNDIVYLPPLIDNSVCDS